MINDFPLMITFAYQFVNEPGIPLIVSLQCAEKGLDEIRLYINFPMIGNINTTKSFMLQRPANCRHSIYDFSM